MVASPRIIRPYEEELVRNQRTGKMYDPRLAAASPLIRLYNAEYSAYIKFDRALNTKGFLVGEEKDIAFESRREEVHHFNIVRKMVQSVFKIETKTLVEGGKKFVERVQKRERKNEFVRADNENGNRLLYVSHTHLHRDERFLLMTQNPLEQLLVELFPHEGAQFMEAIRKDEPKHLSLGASIKARMREDDRRLREYLVNLDNSPGVRIGRVLSDIGADIGLIRLPLAT